MLFNSYSFIFFFLPIALGGFFLAGARSTMLASAWMVLMSLFFYAMWNVNFVGLLVFSIACNFSCGLAITRAAPHSARRSNLLRLGVTCNLILLGIFKYANFFVSSVGALGGPQWNLPTIILPLGISFYSFTQIAFLVDAADGLVTELSLLRYFVFVSYFPHLIAGPVIHHKQVMSQFREPKTYRWNWDAVAVGLAVFSIGIAKKVLIADNLAEYADGIFNAAAQGVEPKFFGAWAGAVAYTFQLYFDFSGYSDMAIGLSLLFNVRLPVNFASPYQARSIIDFWRRWHITLSEFLRDYLYIRLGGNRKGVARRYANLMITMLLGGLWHGASWTFVAWGALHGSYLLVNHAWNAATGRPARDPHWWAPVLTFLAVVIAWVLFRSASFAAAGNMFAGMLGLHGVSMPLAYSAELNDWGIHVVADGFLQRNLPAFEKLGETRLLILLILSSVITWFCANTQELLLLPNRRSWRDSLRRAPVLSGLAFGSLFVWVVANLGKVSTFLYYQF